MDMNEEYGLTPYETREILFYKTDNGEVRVEILLYQENLWLTQAKMAELFEVQKAAISKHLKNILHPANCRKKQLFPKWKQLRQTAVEIVYGRADSTKPNMGLITWKNAPQGRIRKSDVSIAKNYLNEEDILHDKGKVTAAIAKAFAESEFEKFRVLQDRTYQSDFDRLVANIEENSKQTK